MNIFQDIFNGKEDNAKEKLNKIGKHEFLKFLLLLDSGTLHILTGIIHTIDAWTGWGLFDEIKRRTSNAEENIDELIDMLNNIKNDISIKYDITISKKIISIISNLIHQLTRN